MRARNVKPGFFDNEELGRCDPLARILFAGLWCVADRDGKLEWRPERLKLRILPYDKCNIEKLTGQLREKGFIEGYHIDGKLYLRVINFDEHQSPHHTEKRSKIPNPEPTDIITDFPFNGELTAKPPLSSRSRTVSSHRSASIESVNQESGISESVVAIPLLGKEGNHHVTQKMVDEWQELFPALDVPQVLREIRAWNLANPKNRKTRDGIARHITIWLTKAQNKARRDGGNDPYAFMRQGNGQ